MATPTDIERLSYGGDKGSIALGLHRNVIQGTGATRTLLQKESGSLVLFDRATVHTFTLPTPVEGMIFEFLTTVSASGASHKVITHAAGTYIVGGASAVADGAVADAFAAVVGDTYIAITSNATTTGGYAGQNIRLVGLSATLWSVSMIQSCPSGTPATPFATS